MEAGKDWQSAGHRDLLHFRKGFPPEPLKYVKVRTYIGRW